MQLFRAVALAGLAFLTIAVLPTAAWAQDEIAEWETLRPEGEEFEILMPKNSTADVSKEPYHKMTLTTRLYLSDHPSGAVFAVTSMSGIKINPALYSEVERTNSYVDAFKRWFPTKIRGKEAVGKISLVGTKQLNGYMGRNYNFNIGDLSGTLQAFATRKRFYAVVFLNKKKDLVTKDRFLSSFVLPDKQDEPTVAETKQKSDELPEATANADSKKPDGPASADGNTETPTDAKPSDAKPADAKPSEPANGMRRPISGGVLNGKAISLPPPIYPGEARAARVAGVVNVQVTIDEYGSVAAARAVSGHPLLQPAAVNAALQARFSPTYLMGEAVRVTGVLVYNFVAQ